MAKGNRIPWSEWEEQNLPTWLSRNKHLTWAQKEAKYVHDIGIPRTIQSIRGKINQEKLKYQPIPAKASANPHSTARRARRRRLRDSDSSAAHSLAFRPRGSTTGSYQSSLANISHFETASDVAPDQQRPKFRSWGGVSSKTSKHPTKSELRSLKTIRAEMQLDPRTLTRQEHPRVISHLWSAIYRLTGRQLRG